MYGIVIFKSGIHICKYDFQNWKRLKNLFHVSKAQNFPIHMQY